MKTLFAVLASMLLGAPALRAQDSGIALGAPAPGAVVERLDGGKVDLAQYIGKTPVVIQFWAAWCSNCRELEPAIRAARQRHGAAVRFLGIAVNVNQSPERVKRYAERHQLPLEVLYDRTGEAAERYDVPATSYVVVIDRKGKVVYTGVGGDQDIEAALRRAL